MPGLSLPDINVWMAVLLSEHIHHAAVKSWWNSDEFESASFTRTAQMSVLRLLTTAAVMNNKPLTMRAACSVLLG
jgi:predicted nucleic acid-binding protein